MITNSWMSPSARLGNNIFQIGILFVLHKKYGYEIVQPNKGEQFWDCFDVNIKNQEANTNHSYTEQCILEELDNVYSIQDGTDVRGWFQSFIYYKDYKKDYINFLKFKNIHVDEAYKKYETIKAKYNLPLTSVHYRRTDFLDPSSEHIHGNLSKYGYYENAFTSIKDECVYLIFSDDIEWCKNNVKQKNVEYIEFDQYKSLFLMTLCDYNIISNSTFSWWGAFMNKNSTVYAPDKWGGPHLYKSTGNNNCSCIEYKIPKEWIKIPVNHEGY